MHQYFHTTFGFCLWDILALIVLVLLVVVLVGLLSLAPVDQDPWWRESLLLPHFLLIADWSKNLILGFGSQWMTGSLDASSG